jgi:nucleotide-binding universal stress UspA family protein
MAEHADSASTILVVGVMQNQPNDVVRQAVRFAKRLGASLVLATVDPSRYTTGRNADGSITAFPIDPDEAEEITELFEPEFEDHLRRLVEPSGVAWTTRALAGEPAHELARLAHELDAFAIVVGTRKPGLRTTAHEFFNGSVAVHLAHRQHHPVIVIPLEPVAHNERLPWE